MPAHLELIEAKTLGGLPFISQKWKEKVQLVQHQIFNDQRALKTLLPHMG